MSNWWNELVISRKALLVLIVYGFIIGRLSLSWWPILVIPGAVGFACISDYIFNKYFK